MMAFLTANTEGSKGPKPTAPTVSVVITTYNYAKFIEQCIDSVLSQDYPSERLEIIVADDGSTDDTCERLKKYGSKIKYFRKPNGGQASNINFGFSKATSEIVSLLDADDYLLPGKLTRISEEFCKNPEVGLVYHRLMNLYSRSGNIAPAGFIGVAGFARGDSQKLAKLLHLQTSAIAFRRSVTQRLLPIPETILMQAEAYLVTLTALAAPVWGIDESLAIYRIHGANAYCLEEPSAHPDLIARNLTRSIIVLGELRRWTIRNPEFSGSAHARSFLEEEILNFENAKFKVDPPGRLRFFFFLLRQVYVNRGRQTWRFTFYQLLTAPFALFFGYGRAQLLYSLRDKGIRIARSALPGFLRRSTDANN